MVRFYEVHLDFDRRVLLFFHFLKDQFSDMAQLKWLKVVIKFLKMMNFVNSFFCSMESFQFQLWNKTYRSILATVTYLGHENEIVKTFNEWSSSNEYLARVPPWRRWKMRLHLTSAPTIHRRFQASSPSVTTKIRLFYKDKNNAVLFRLYISQWW